MALIAAACSASGSEESDGAGSGGSDGGGESSSSAAKPGASGTTSTADSAWQRATAAYLAMWQDMAQAATTSNWKSPQLARNATGDALSAITRGIYADSRNGLVTKGEPKNAPKVTKVDPAANPTTVMISDCGDSSHWLKYRKDSGDLADDKPGGRQQITAEVKKQDDGSWKVTRFAVEGVGSC